MLDYDSHSTDLSVSAEEGHPTILLPHFIFGLQLRTKLFSNSSYAAKLHKNAQKSYFCCTIIRPKNVCFFGQLLSNFWLFFEQVFSNVLRDYGKLFGKSLVPCGKPYVKEEPKQASAPRRLSSKGLCHPFENNLESINLNFSSSVGDFGRLFLSVQISRLPG